MAIKFKYNTGIETVLYQTHELLIETNKMSCKCRKDDYIKHNTKKVLSERRVVLFCQVAYYIVWLLGSPTCGYDPI